MGYSTPGFPVLHHLQEFAQIHVYWVSDAIEPSYPLPPSSPFAFGPSQHQDLFPVNALFASGGQSVGASSSALVLPVNIQGWLPFSTVTQSCPTLCNPMDCSTPGFPVHHQLPELAQTDVHWVGDAIQPFHPLSSPSPALSFSQHQGLFQRVSSSHQAAKYWSFSISHSNDFSFENEFWHFHFGYSV